MPTWANLSDPRFPFQLRYPDPTPAGCLVRVNIRQGEQSYRLHLVSEGSAEVYFEVGRYDKLPRQAAIEQFLAEVNSRIEGLRHGEVVETEFNGLPASRVMVQWPDRERVVLFFERAGTLFRIIYDPASPTNLEILDSFAWVQDSQGGG